MQRQLFDLVVEPRQVRADALEQQLDGRRRDRVSALARERSDPRRDRAWIRPRQLDGRAGLRPPRVQRSPLIEPLRDEDEARTVIELRDDRQHRVLDGTRQRFGAANDQRGGAAEERRRHQVGDRRLQPRRLVVPPDDADAAVPEPRPQPRQCPLDQERIVAVEQIVRPERRALDRRERIGRRAARRPARWAQKPSMLCT